MVEAIVLVAGAAVMIPVGVPLFGASLSILKFVVVVPGVLNLLAYMLILSLLALGFLHYHKKQVQVKAKEAEASLLHEGAVEAKQAQKPMNKVKAKPQAGASPRRSPAVPTPPSQAKPPSSPKACPELESPAESPTGHVSAVPEPEKPKKALAKKKSKKADQKAAVDNEQHIESEDGSAFELVRPSGFEVQLSKAEKRAKAAEARRLAEEEKQQAALKEQEEIALRKAEEDLLKQEIALRKAEEDLLKQEQEKNLRILMEEQELLRQTEEERFRMEEEADQRAREKKEEAARKAAEEYALAQSRGKTIEAAERQWYKACKKEQAPSSPDNTCWDFKLYGVCPRGAACCWSHGLAKDAIEKKEEEKMDLPLTLPPGLFDNQSKLPPPPGLFANPAENSLKTRLASEAPIFVPTAMRQVLAEQMNPGLR